MKHQIRTTRLLSYIALITSIAFLFGCGGGTGSGNGSGSNTKVIDQTETLGNLKTLNLSLALYAQDYDQIFPNASTFATLRPLLFPYGRDSSNFTDPNTNLPFAWNGYLSGKPLSTVDYTGYVTFWVATPVIPNARPVATFNQTSKLVTDTEWAQLKTTSHIP